MTDEWRLKREADAADALREMAPEIENARRERLGLPPLEPEPLPAPMERGDEGNGAEL